MTLVACSDSIGEDLEMAPMCPSSLIQGKRSFHKLMEWDGSLTGLHFS